MVLSQSVFSRAVTAPRALIYSNHAGTEGGHCCEAKWCRAFLQEKHKIFHPTPQLGRPTLPPILLFNESRHKELLYQRPMWDGLSCGTPRQVYLTYRYYPCNTTSQSQTYTDPNTLRGRLMDFPTSGESRKLLEAWIELHSIDELNRIELNLLEINHI